MPISYEDAKKLGIAHLHPSHPGGAEPFPGALVTVGRDGKPSKYKAVPTVYNGVRYDSKGEAGRAAQLDLAVKAGLILWWVRQVKFRLGVPENVFVADFLVVKPDGVHVEDYKGMKTAKFLRDVKLWKSYGPCDLHVVTRDSTEVVPGGLARGPVSANGSD